MKTHKKTKKYRASSPNTNNVSDVSMRFLYRNHYPVSFRSFFRKKRTTRVHTQTKKNTRNNIMMAILRPIETVKEKAAETKRTVV